MDVGWGGGGGGVGGGGRVRFYAPPIACVHVCGVCGVCVCVWGGGGSFSLGLPAKGDMRSGLK